MRTLLTPIVIVIAAGIACGGQISTDSPPASSVEDESTDLDEGSEEQAGDAPDEEAGEAPGDEADTEGGDAIEDGTDDSASDSDAGSDAGSAESDGAEGLAEDTLAEGGSDVADMQRADLVPGTPVTLRNVVVTSTMSIEAPGFYVQDMGGGEWSGVFVYTQEIESDAGDPEPAALTVSVGDVLNLSGTSEEYHDLTELVLDSMDDVEVVGTSAAVTTTELDAVPDDWEPYEGVLVRLVDVDITGVPVPEGSGPGEIAPQTNWDLSVADQLMPIEMEAGESFSSITGIVTYSWNLYRIAPRTLADLAE